MRRNLAAGFPSLLCLLLMAPAPTEASVLSIQLLGPSREAWEEAEEDFANGGLGEVPDTEFYRRCTVDLGPLCHYLWSQGLAAGDINDPDGTVSELFLSGLGDDGFS